MWRLWTTLGFEDLSDRYRRTLFGISWVVTSFAVFVGVKILVFGQMATVSLAEFALFVTIGFGLWTFISTVIVDACVAYIHSANWVLGSNIPYPVFFLQVLFRNWLVFLMILFVMVAALAWQRDGWSTTMLAAIHVIETSNPPGWNAPSAPSSIHASVSPQKTITNITM